MLGGRSRFGYYFSNMYSLIVLILKYPAADDGCADWMLGYFEVRSYHDDLKGATLGWAFTRRKMRLGAFPGVEAQAWLCLIFAGLSAHRTPLVAAI